MVREVRWKFVDLSHRTLFTIKYGSSYTRYLIQIIASFSSFSVFNISQGSVATSVATHLMWGGISINNVIASFLLNVSVKELWKLVNI